MSDEPLVDGRLAWIRQRVSPKEWRSSATGWNAVGWESSVWILHAMYETDTLPAGLTVHEERDIEGAASPMARAWASIRSSHGPHTIRFQLQVGP